MIQFDSAQRYIFRLLDALPTTLTYHGKHHTLDVLSVVRAICRRENISEHESKLLEIAAAFHDAGFLMTYKCHEEKSCELAQDILPRFAFSDEDIEQICGMIMATKIPQSPKNKLEQILCDADLDYLGRGDFERIAATLFQEMKNFNLLHDENEWNRIQVKFLQSHQYFTRSSRKMRSPRKQKHLQVLQQTVCEVASL
jgi:predicted metal-dependent HD superfamily phosphohydrolase